IAPAAKPPKAARSALPQNRLLTLFSIENSLDTTRNRRVGPGPPQRDVRPPPRTPDPPDRGAVQEVGGRSQVDGPGIPRCLDRRQQVLGHGRGVSRDEQRIRVRDTGEDALRAGPTRSLIVEVGQADRGGREAAWPPQREVSCAGF